MNSVHRRLGGAGPPTFGGHPVQLLFIMSAFGGTPVEHATFGFVGQRLYFSPNQINNLAEVNPLRCRLGTIWVVPGERDITTVANVTFDDAGDSILIEFRDFGGSE